MRITIIPFNVLMRALTSNHTLIRRGQIEIVLKILKQIRYVNLKIYNSNEQETTEPLYIGQWCKPMRSNRRR